MEFKALNKQGTVLAKITAPDRKAGRVKLTRKLEKLGRMEAWKNSHYMMKWIDPTEKKGEDNGKGQGKPHV